MLVKLCYFFAKYDWAYVGILNNLPLNQLAPGGSREKVITIFDLIWSVSTTTTTTIWELACGLGNVVLRCGMSTAIASGRPPAAVVTMIAGRTFRWGLIGHCRWNQRHHYQTSNKLNLFLSGWNFPADWWPTKTHGTSYNFPPGRVELCSSVWWLPPKLCSWNNQTNNLMDFVCGKLVGWISWWNKFSLQRAEIMNDRFFRQNHQGRSLS